MSEEAGYLDNALLITLVWATALGFSEQIKPNLKNPPVWLTELTPLEVITDDAKCDLMVSVVSVPTTQTVIHYSNLGNCRKIAILVIPIRSVRYPCMHFSRPSVNMKWNFVCEFIMLNTVHVPHINAHGPMLTSQSIFPRTLLLWWFVQRQPGSVFIALTG